MHEFAYGVRLSLEPSCRHDTRTVLGFSVFLGSFGFFYVIMPFLAIANEILAVRSTTPLNLCILVNLNLKSFLAHKRQLQLINVDPELLAYPVLQIKQPRDRGKQFTSYRCSGWG